MCGIRSGRSAIAVIATLAVIACLAGVIVYLQRSGNDPAEGQNGDATAAAEQLQLAVEAVSASEDADYRRAMELWKALQQSLPEESAVQLNRAVTVLKWIDESNNRLSSGTVTDAEERATLEAELAVAYQEADQVIEVLSQLDTNDYRITLLEAALLEAKARQLPYPQDQELRKQAAATLAAALQQNPAQPLLACKFDDLVQEIAQEGDALSKLNADALYAAWQTQPRNLYLLSRASETLLAAEDSRLVDLLEPSVDATRSMWSMVQRYVDQLKPDELVKNIRSAVTKGDWRAAQGLRRWLNVLKGMSGFQPDGRLLKPDIMALLDTAFLAPLSNSIPSSTVEVSPRQVSYRMVDLNANANVIAWYDYDVDLLSDLITLHGEQLTLFKNTPGEGVGNQPEQTLELGWAARGLLIADLFEVDDPNRPRVADSVQELMSEGTQAEEANVLVSGSRHDTLQELVVWGEEGVRIVGPRSDGSEEFTLQVESGEFGFQSLSGVVAAVALDIESDGDLDLVFATAEGIRIFQNNGNRSFEDLTSFSQLEGMPSNIASFVACDYDADLDQDVLAVSPDSGSVLLLENILHGQFRFRALSEVPWPTLDGPTDLLVADIDGNFSWDWLVSTSQGISGVLTRTTSPGSVVARGASLFGPTAKRINLADLNNDASLDVLAATANGLELMLGSEGRSPGSDATARFSEASIIAGVVGEVGGLDIADCNLDGAMDVAVLENGRAKLLIAEDVAGGYLNVRVRGISDPNGGGRINHYSIGSTLEVWSGGRLQRRVIDSPNSHFGLGEQNAENLRIVFTNGLTQNVESPKVDSLVEERQELKGSCPFLYGWDGERFVMITDLLWNAPLGLQTARGEVLRDRRWEYLLLPEELVQPRDGGIDLRVTEELWEFAYFDHLQLTAIDHPDSTQVYSNEKVGPPTLATPQLFEVSQLKRPVSALGSNGSELRRQLEAKDQIYATAFKQLVCQGLTEPHFLELDFGPLPTSESLKLVLTGWLYPTDTSLNIGISQNSEASPPEPPSLWVVDEDGRWVCAQPFMGFPGGKPKSIVVDLDGVFRSNDHRLRIGSSQQLYWDEVFIAWGTEPKDLVEQPVALESAELRYRGFSRLLAREPDQPHWYDYEQVERAPKWPELEGPFTRFGDVKSLLVADDDQIVVMTSGDEIVLRFAAPARELPPGWRRDFVLHSVGWDKDADINTLAGQGALPLPFAKQSSYPPPPEQANQGYEVWRKNESTLQRIRQDRQFEAELAN